jgi:hypothetical protein
MAFDRNLRFTGRESELSKLDKPFFQDGQNTKVAVIGVGGVGKTRLVIEIQELEERGREKEAEAKAKREEQRAELQRQQDQHIRGFQAKSRGERQRLMAS